MKSAETKKKQRKKLMGAVVGAILVGLVFSSLPCSGMEVLTPEELGNLSGQVGISLAFAGTFTLVKNIFKSISMGDTDGWGNSAAVDMNAGWLSLVGDGTNTGTISIIIPNGAQMDFNVAKTGANTCTPAGGTPYAGISIPPNTNFFNFSLTDFSFKLYNPTTVRVTLTNNPAQAIAGQEVCGYIYPVGVAINKAHMTSECYIWYH